MGILRKGPYAAPANHESPEVRQRRQYLESKEERRKRQQEIDTRMESVECEEWSEKLSREEKGKLVIPKAFCKPGSAAHNQELREYFRENVWPQIGEAAVKIGLSGESYQKKRGKIDRQRDPLDINRRRRRQLRGDHFRDIRHLTQKMNLFKEPNRNPSFRQKDHLSEKKITSVLTPLGYKRPRKIDGSSGK